MLAYQTDTCRCTVHALCLSMPPPVCCRRSMNAAAARRCTLCRARTGRWSGGTGRDARFVNSTSPSWSVFEPPITHVHVPSICATARRWDTRIYLLYHFLPHLPGVNLPRFHCRQQTRLCLHTVVHRFHSLARAPQLLVLPHPQSRR